MDEKEQTRLASRTSFFSRGPLCTRQECVSGSHWLGRYNSSAPHSPPAAGPVLKRQRKKSIIPESYLAHLKGVGVQKEQEDHTPVQKENRRPSAPKRKQIPTRCRRRRGGTPKSEPRTINPPRMKGTFYGDAQPPSFLQPIPQLQSYSDQSDCDSLIDDADADPEDTGWVGELMDTLGSYAQKDFSQIDRQRDRRMETSYHRIMEEERRTAKIGIETDRREAQKNRAEERQRKRSAFILDDI